MPTFVLDDLVEFQSIPHKLKFNLVCTLLTVSQDKRIKNRNTNNNICIFKIGPLRSTHTLPSIINCIIETDQSYSHSPSLIDWKSLLKEQIVYLTNCSISSFRLNLSKEFLIFKCSTIVPLFQHCSFDNPTHFTSIQADQFNGIVSWKDGLINYNGLVTCILSKHLGIYVLDNEIVFLTCGLLTSGGSNFSIGEFVSIWYVHPFKLVEGGYKFLFVSCCCSFISIEHELSNNNSTVDKSFLSSFYHLSLNNLSQLFNWLKVWKRLYKLKNIFSTDKQKSLQIIKRIFSKYLLRGKGGEEIGNDFYFLIDHHNQCQLNKLERVIYMEEEKEEESLNSLFLTSNCLLGIFDVDTDGDICLLSLNNTISIKIQTTDRNILSSIGTLSLIFDFEFVKNSLFSYSMLSLPRIPTVIAEREKKPCLLKNSYLITTIYPLMRDYSKKYCYFFLQLSDLKTNESYLCKVIEKACCYFSFLSPKQIVTLFDYKIEDEIIYLSSINSIQIEEAVESKEQSNGNNLIYSNLIDELIVTLIDFYQSVNKTEIILILKQINSSNSFSLSIDTNKFILPAYTSLNNLILKFKNILIQNTTEITTLKYVQFSTISYLINCSLFPNHNCYNLLLISNYNFKENPVIFTSNLTALSILSIRWKRKNNNFVKECNNCKEMNCFYCYSFNNFEFELYLLVHDYSAEFIILINSLNKLINLFTGNGLEHFVEKDSTNNLITQLTQLFTSELYFKCNLHLIGIRDGDEDGCFLSQNVTYRTRSCTRAIFFVIDIKKKHKELSIKETF